MVTQAEIEAAIETYLHVGIGENIHAGMLAILEAAARARPKRKDNTRAERARRFRAKRNAVTGAGDRRNGVPGERNAVKDWRAFLGLSELPTERAGPKCR